MRQQRVLWLFVPAFVIALAGMAAGQNFNFKTVVIPKAQSTSTVAINDNGVLAGFYTDSTGVQHGFMLSGHTLTNIDDPNGTSGSTFCWGINNNNEVVGYYTNSSTGHVTGFSYQGGTFTDVSFPGSTQTQAFGVDDVGEIVGQYVDPSTGIALGFLDSGGVFTALQYPGSLSTLAYAIFNFSPGFSEITVDYENSNLFTKSTIYTTNTQFYSNINVPGAVNSAIHGISQGGIVFSWTDSSGNVHGALLRSGTFYTFDDPSGTSTRADGINASGVIVGRFNPTGTSVFQGFRANRVK